MIGKEKKVLAGVSQNNGWRSQLDVSNEGTLIYEERTDSGRSLVWVEATEEGNVRLERFTELNELVPLGGE